MRVEPITDKKKVKDIKTLLKAYPRDYALFVCGINNGLRGGDLLALKVSQVRHKKSGDYVEIRELKTHKINYFFLNKTCHKAVQNLIKQYDLDDNDYLFPSRKNNGQLHTYTLNRLIKKWCSQVGLQGNFGSHTLRKTWAYHQRTQYGTGWEIISRRLNHSTPGQTRVYLGVSDNEVRNVMLNEI